MAFNKSSDRNDSFSRHSPKGNFRISRREIWCAVGECLAKRGSNAVPLGHPLNERSPPVLGGLLVWVGGDLLSHGLSQYHRHCRA